MKALLIDDEYSNRSLLANMLAKHCPDVEVIGYAEMADSAYEMILDLKPDLIFLDIKMPGKNGFDLLRQFTEINFSIIFVTGFDEYAIKAFESHAVDYLLKPFDQLRFDKAIAKWNEQKSNSTEKATQDLLESASLSPSQSQRIVVKNGSKIKIIPVHEVFYLEAADDYVKIHTQEGYFLKNKTMNHFEQSLDGDQFVRCHRSYFVNVQQITRIDPYEKDGHVAVLRSGAKVPVSRSGYGKLKEVLGL